VVHRWLCLPKPAWEAAAAGVPVASSVVLLFSDPLAAQRSVALGVLPSETNPAGLTWPGLAGALRMRMDARADLSWMMDGRWQLRHPLRVS
jgi:hypothetical protein